jgi:hypothetical protein
VQVSENKSVRVGGNRSVRVCENRCVSGSTATWNAGPLVYATRIFTAWFLDDIHFPRLRPGIARCLIFCDFDKLLNWDNLETTERCFWYWWYTLDIAFCGD